ALFVVFNGVGVWRDTLTFVALLFVIVLLHEFGHCLGSRLVGGNPTEIMMHPLGGLASAGAPHRPWPNFVTVLARPMVNVLICLLMTGAIMAIAGTWRVLPWNVYRGMTIETFLRVHQHGQLFYYSYWIFLISWGLLLFNLLPIYPLDGGQLLQSLIWAW